MLLMSQLLEKLSPPYLKIGSVKVGAADWKIELQPYSDNEHQNAYLMNFEIPYDKDTKVLTGPRGEKGDAATIDSISYSVGDNPSVKNIGTKNNAKLEFILPRGRKGDRGEQGPKGETGPCGEKGDTGANGMAAVIKVGNVSRSRDGLIHVTAGEPELKGGRLETQLNFQFPEHIMTGDVIEGGVSATIRVGKVTSGDKALVTNVGTSQEAILDFVLPRGPKGEDGRDGKDGNDCAIFPEIKIGEVKTIAPGSSASVSINTTEDGRVVELNFSIPRGADGTVIDEQGKEVVSSISSISIGKVTSGDFASVENVGTPENVILDFVLPKGPKGDTGSAASIKIGNVTTGETPKVYNSGDENNAILNFVLPGTSDVSISKINASKIYFSDNQTLQDKLNKNLLGNFKFSNDVIIETLDSSKSANARLAGDGTQQNPYVLNLGLPRGINGEKGDDGKSASIKIGTVEQRGKTLMVTNSGDSQNAVLNFTFPESWGSSQSTGSTVSDLKPASALTGTIGTSSVPFGSGAFGHLLVAGKNVRQYEIFTTGGTFTVPAGTNKIYITATGGGGGGAFGFGGGGAESIYHQTYNVSPGQSIDITIGAGGTGYTYVLNGSALTGNYSGANGGDTVIGNLITLKGGKGATANFSSGNYFYGGIAGGKGGTNGTYMMLTEVNNYSNDKHWVGGTGGGTMLGTGGSGGFFKNWDPSPSQRVSGSSGVGFGSGGGGSGVFVNNATGMWYSTTCGSGAPGIVIIEWE